MAEPKLNPTSRPLAPDGALPGRVALLLVDVQQGFDDPCWGLRNNPEAESRMAQLLEAWRQRSLPVIHIQHCSTDPDSPLRPDLPGSALKEATGPRPGELVIQKQVNSAFIQTPLETHLRCQSISALVVVGFTTDHCVSTTVRMAANLGFTVFLVADAAATFDREGVDGHWYPAEVIHQIHLASLHGEFCTVLSCADVIGGLEGGSTPSLPTGTDPWRDGGFQPGRNQLRLTKSSSTDPERRLRQEPVAPSGVPPTPRAARRSHPGRLSPSGRETVWVHLKRPSIGAIAFPYVPRRNLAWGLSTRPCGSTNRQFPTLWARLAAERQAKCPLLQNINLPLPNPAAVYLPPL